MMQSTNNNQITSITEFVDSVFVELNHWETEYSYFDCKDLANWKNTLIPLAVNLYELAQTDDAVFWWLLQLMSHVDVCKDRKEDLRKSDVFAVLSKLKQEHQKIILEKCLPTCAEKLQKALENDEQDAFKRILPVIDENDAFYSIGRLLKRVEEVRDIYEKTISHTKGDSLGRLFVLFRRYYEYFANSYDNNQRSCDGMAKNIFLALYQTQYREDNNEFCEVTYNIGELWVRGLVLAYHNYNTQMPPVASDIVLDTLQKQDEEFHKALSNCFSEKQIVSLMEEYGGWLELEEYSFIYNVLQVSKEVRSDTTPPFSCLCTDKKKKRKRICGNVEHRDNREKNHYQDNCVPYLDSKNAIPMEELLKLRKDVPRLFELENKANHFNGCVDEGSQVVIEETLNEKARRLIGDLLPELKDHLNPRYKTEKLEKFFDDILISKDRPINEQVAQETIVKKLFNNRSKYEYQGLKVIVFCRIIGYLLSEKVSVLTGEPKPIAEKLQPFLTKTNVQNGKDPKSVENLRSYIDKAKTGITKPPGKSLIDKVLGLKES